MAIQEIINARASSEEQAKVAILDCAAECQICIQVCDRCADACLAEKGLPLIQCIRASLDGAEMCAAAGAIMSRRFGHNWEVIRSVIEACATACEASAAECEQHLALEHCRECAIACRKCARACRDAAAAMLLAA
jgi:hypothetical protein